MTATKLPRIPDTGNTFAELVYLLTLRFESERTGAAETRRSQAIAGWPWPTHPAMLACALVPISRKLWMLAEHECNVPEPEEGHYSRQRIALGKQAKALLPGSINIRFLTDPIAGYGLGLIFPDGRTNDFGQTCVIVPTKVTA